MTDRNRISSAEQALERFSVKLTRDASTMVEPPRPSDWFRAREQPFLRKFFAEDAATSAQGARPPTPAK
eukprot:1640508-Prymnesium_polylepis.1